MICLHGVVNFVTCIITTAHYSWLNDCLMPPLYPLHAVDLHSWLCLRARWLPCMGHPSEQRSHLRDRGLENLISKRDGTKPLIYLWFPLHCLSLWIKVIFLDHLTFLSWQEQNIFGCNRSQQNSWKQKKQLHLYSLFFWRTPAAVRFIPAAPEWCIQPVASLSHMINYRGDTKYCGNTEYETLRTKWAIY